MSRIAPNRLKSQLKMAAILNFSLIHDVIKIITFPMDSVTVNISIIDQWGPLNKMIPLMEDPGGGVHGDPSGPMDY